ncbi:MAG: hypothetical protein WEE36_10855 [Acidimicrobiia bacterium]
MRRLSVLPLLALAIASCGGSGATDDTDLSTTAATTTTLLATTTAATTTTTIRTTTTAAPTTTTEPADDPWVDGATVLRAGDCLIETPGSGGGAPEFEAAPCDSPHQGEVVGTGASCPAGISQADFTALASAYVGVGEDEFFDWMNREGLTAVSKARFGGGGQAEASMCLLSSGSDLFESYRATTE